MEINMKKVVIVIIWDLKKKNHFNSLHEKIQNILEGGRWWSLFKKFEPCEYNESKTNPKVSKIGFICTNHLHCLACISDLFVILLFYSNLYIDIFTHLFFLKMGRVKKNKSHVFY